MLSEALTASASHTPINFVHRVLAENQGINVLPMLLKIAIAGGKLYRRHIKDGLLRTLKRRIAKKW